MKYLLILSLIFLVSCIDRYTVTVSVYEPGCDTCAYVIKVEHKRIPFPQPDSVYVVRQDLSFYKKARK